MHTNPSCLLVYFSRLSPATSLCFGKILDGVSKHKTVRVRSKIFKRKN